MGDANGVGPEILLRTLKEKMIKEDFVVYGDVEVLLYAADQLGISRETVRTIPMENLSLLESSDVTPGHPDSKVGAAAADYVVAAAQDAKAKKLDAIVTLPINKEATRASRPSFSGHTELIAEICGNPPVTMMLVSDQLVVTHVSTHVPLREAIELVKTNRILEVIRLTHSALKRIRPTTRIAVAGINPHAGEHGAFGTEDNEQIRPAVELAQQEGIDVSGPEPGDTVFFNAVQRKRFDAVVCMYHDQGHIPMKTLDFDGGINATLGLPIVRTSVDHGTAYDIAYQGRAHTRSFLLAIEMAKRLSR